MNVDGARAGVQGAARPARPAGAKPLLGFGPVGWALLLPLGALLIIAATGYDLRYQLQHWVNECWGWDGLVFFTLNVIFGHAWASWFWPPLPHFGLAGLCIVLVGLQLHPRRVGAARVALLVVLGVLLPVGIFCMYQRNPLFHAGDTDAQFALTRLIAGTMVATALWLATRSARVGLLSAAAMTLAPALDWAAVMSSIGELPASLGPQIDHARQWVGLLMNVALAAILWTWGVRGRLAIRPGHCCQACGYDLRGLEESGSAACPECGGAAAPGLSTLHGPEPRHTRSKWPAPRS